jgi:hypothetical protein
MKTLRFLLINLFVRDHKKTLEIIDGLDRPSYSQPSDVKYSDHIGNYLLCDDPKEEILVLKTEKKLNNVKVKESPKVKTKRDELVDALNYLKSKSDKTKQDKDSIYTLEVLLKNTPN